MKRLMLTCAFAAILTAALPACAASGPQCATMDATALVKTLQPEASLRSMLLAVMPTTTTYRMAAAKDSNAVERALPLAVDHAVARHLPEWSSNLVKAWSAIDKAQIVRACNAAKGGDQTPFMQLQQKVAPMAQSLNEPVLRNAGAEVLEEIMENS